MPPVLLPLSSSAPELDPPVLDPVDEELSLAAPVLEVEVDGPSLVLAPVLEAPVEPGVDGVPSSPQAQQRKSRVKSRFEGRITAAAWTSLVRESASMGWIVSVAAAVDR
jgi:hypothetical protein